MELVNITGTYWIQIWITTRQLGVKIITPTLANKNTNLASNLS